MVQGYYTLEEAAQILGMSAEELKQFSKQGELRAFQDRGTLRFRTQDVEELARQRGARSDVDLPLGEAPRPKAADSPPPRTPVKKPDEVFGFSLDSGDEQVQIGQEIFSESPSKRRGDSKKSLPPTPTPNGGPKSAGPKSSGPKAPPPKSPPPRRADTVLGAEEQKKSTPPAPGRKSGAHLDSGARLVGLESDSDVKIVGVDSAEVQVAKHPSKSGTDSDIRLDSPPKSGGSKSGKSSHHENLLTEEIDLDAEIRKAEEAARAKSDPKARALPKSDPQIPAAAPKAQPPQFPETSPFELSDDDSGPGLAREPARTPEVKKRSSDSSSELETRRSPESSSDFDLTPAADDSSPLELGSDEFQLEVGEESDVDLGTQPPRKGAASGINLKDPADSGISLEQGGEGSDEIEFELSLDEGSTPKPAAPVDADSDSEFELTIDETGGLAPVEEEPPPAQDEKDIFETDFDVPALEDESGSQAVALDESDTDLDSSDFDIALSDADMAIEDESGSQVVALEEEEETDDAAATIQHPKKKKGTLLLDEQEVAEEEGGGIDELLTGEEEPVAEEVEEEEEAAPAGAAVAAPAAEWGPIPVIFLIPCVAILLLVGMMGFELLQGVMGYHKPGPLTEKLGKVLNLQMPKN
jgi:excisionase family DNA binding protein